MKRNKIVLNILTTYGRSCISFFLTLFTARWVLGALGEEDFGLYGLVGGVMFFVSLFNITQSTTVARFYAYTLGQDESKLCAWFNSALSLHLALPLMLLTIGYPVGIYVFEHCLAIPDARMTSCLWVFRCSMLTLFLSIVSVPYSAMFVAYQHIYQLVIFSMVHVLGGACVAYMLLHVSCDRLVCYAIMSFLLNLLVYALQFIWARKQFCACHIDVHLMFDREKIVKMLRFTAIKLLGDFAWGVRTNGAAFVANIGFGASANAALNVSNQLSTQAASLCNTVSTAFVPAITTEEGGGHRDSVIDLAIRCSKFGTLLLFFVAVPLIVEIDYWLELWLKKPPANCEALCVCMIIGSALVYLTNGYQIALQAEGNIFRWQLADSISYMIAIPVACLLVWGGCGLCSIGYGIIASSIMISCVRLYYAKKQVGFRYMDFIRKVFIPCLLSALISFAMTYSVRFLLPNGFMQFVVAGFVSVFAIVVSSWVFALIPQERAYLLSLGRKWISRIKRQEGCI